MIMPESAVGVAGYSSISSVQSSVVSDLFNVFPERSEATEVGDVPAVLPDIRQLPFYGSPPIACFPKQCCS